MFRLFQKRENTAGVDGFSIFSPRHQRMPLRLEFFGDEIESIKTFDVETQRSKEEVI